MILINKKEGELLSELVARARAENDIAPNVPITYAGRLDPMAEGLMILLVGEEVHEKEKYLGLPKTYSFDVLFGVSTDTHDALGVIDETSVPNLGEENIFNTAQTFVGEFNQSYPMFSSKTVSGKPLFMYAKEKEEVIVPTHAVELFNIELISSRAMSGEECVKDAVRRIQSVNGDFRQRECISSWETFSKSYSENSFLCVRFTATVSSGFYVRMFARDLAKKLGKVGLAWWIKREEIGSF